MWIIGLKEFNNAEYTIYKICFALLGRSSFHLNLSPVSIYIEKIMMRLIELQRGGFCRMRVSGGSENIWMELFLNTSIHHYLIKGLQVYMLVWQELPTDFIHMVCFHNRSVKVVENYHPILLVVMLRWTVSCGLDFLSGMTSECHGLLTLVRFFTLHLFVMVAT